MNGAHYITCFLTSPLKPWAHLKPWFLTQQAESVVAELIKTLNTSEYQFTDGIAVHRSAILEPGAVLKSPCVVGPRCFIAAGAYLRGGCWLEADDIIGPGAELKSSFLFQGTKLAHFNFVGDSILGEGVNLEAGSIIANYRNEREDKEIWVRDSQKWVKTGVTKFGAVVGDHCRVGANAVIAPGTFLLPQTVIGRLSLYDEETRTPS